MSSRKPIQKYHDYRSPHKRTTLFILIGFLCLMLVGGGLYYFLQKSEKTSQPNSNSSETSQAKTTSTQPSAQNDFTTGQERKEPTLRNTEEGIVTDNTGTNIATTPQNQWSKSADGTSIVVYAPTQNTSLKSGDIVSGTSTAGKVNFRLIDNVSGVISQGTISVVDGKFSGTFSFTTSATEGRLDIFTADADGIETNNIYIPVRFN